MIFIFYKMVFLAALFFVLPFEFMKRPRGKRRMWLREKLGHLDAAAGPALWVHAVSVGEAAAAVPFIKKVKEMRPDLDVVVSTITDTGRKVAKERLGALARVVYLPFDIECVVKRAIDNISPVAFVVMETELWPVLFKTLNSAGVPVLIMNGRVSEGSFKGYMRARFFMRKVLGLVSLLCMQETVYAERIKALGAPEGKVKVTGNFKFDIKPPKEPPAWARALKEEDGGPVLVAASTHRGEDELMLSVFARLRKGGFPSLRLILAPRHPERADEVSGLIEKTGLTYVRRSELDGQPEEGVSVILLDAVGELASVYGACDVAVMGGSFIPHGGQSPLEPAYWGVPVVCGPHMENFPFMDEFYAEGAALRAERDTLFDALNGLLLSSGRREAAGRSAREIFMQNSGAVQRAAGMLMDYLG